MGAWGIKYFDNDDAGDFMGGLSDAPVWSTVKSAFDAVAAIGDEYLESPEASAAVAAAAVVAHKKTGLVVTTFPEDLDVLVNLGTPPQELVKFALQVLDRVQREPSELPELWDEAGEKEAWIATLTSLSEALSA